MKAREPLAVSVLRGIVAAVKNLKVERRGTALTDAELVQVVRREARKREEARDFARQAGRDDLVAQNDAELGVLAAYLPQAPSADTLEAKVRQLAAEVTSPDVGTLMRMLKAEYGAALDGRVASQLVKEVLAAPKEGGA